MCKKLVRIFNCGKAQAWPSSVMCSLSTMCNLIPPPHSHELFLLNTVAYPSHFTFVRLLADWNTMDNLGEKHLKSKFFQGSILIIYQFPCLSSYCVARRVKKKIKCLFFFHCLTTQQLLRQGNWFVTKTLTWKYSALFKKLSTNIHISKWI